MSWGFFPTYPQASRLHVHIRVLNLSHSIEPFTSNTESAWQFTRATVHLAIPEHTLLLPATVCTQSCFNAEGEYVHRISHEAMRALPPSRSQWNGIAPVVAQRLTSFDQCVTLRWPRPCLRTVQSPRLSTTILAAGTSVIAWAALLFCVSTSTKRNPPVSCLVDGCALKPSDPSWAWTFVVASRIHHVLACSSHCTSHCALRHVSSIR